LTVFGTNIDKEVDRLPDYKVFGQVTDVVGLLIEVAGVQGKPSAPAAEAPDPSPQPSPEPSPGPSPEAGPEQVEGAPGETPAESQEPLEPFDPMLAPAGPVFQTLPDPPPPPPGTGAKDGAKDGAEDDSEPPEEEPPKDPTLV
jgi:hypothetical protein